MIELKVLAVEKEGRATEYRLSPSPVMLGGKDSYGVETLHLTVPPAWAGKTVFATFTPELCEGKAWAMSAPQTDENAVWYCELDVQQDMTVAAKGLLTISAAIGGKTDDDGNVIETTSVMHTHSIPYIAYDHADLGTEVTEEPSPDAWDQYIASVQEAVEKAFGYSGRAGAAAAQAKRSAEELTGFFNSKRINLFDKNVAKFGYYIKRDSNEEIAYEGTCISDYIEVAAGDVIRTIRCASAGKENQGRFYDSNQVGIGTVGDGDQYGTEVVSGGTNIVKTTVPEGACYLRINIDSSKIDTLMIVKNMDYPDTYIPYDQVEKSLRSDVDVPGYATEKHVADTVDGIKKEIEEAGYVDDDYVNEKLEDVLSDGAQSSSLYKKHIACCGDSIMEGRLTGTAANGGAWAKLIGDKNNMSVNNKGLSGSRIANYYDEDGTFVNSKTIACQLESLDTGYDYIILDGGVNDFSVGVALGKLLDGYSVEASDYDRDTILGSLEYICMLLNTKYCDSKFGWVFNHRIYTESVEKDGIGTWHELKEAMKACFGKWGVPCLDLEDVIPPLNLIQTLKAAYTCNGDGWHPNKAGYAIFYCDKIEAWLKASCVPLSFVSLTDYVKNTDYASTTKAGVVKVGNGLRMDSSKALGIWGATESQINDKAANQFAITPFNLDYAIKSGLANNNQEWTEEEQQSARAVIGAIGVTEYPDAADKAGVVKVNSGAYGIGVYPTNGYLYIAPASNEELDAKTHERRPIVPANLDYAIKVGLITNANKLTEQEQGAIHKWLGLTTATNEARPYTIVKRTAGGVIFVGEPTDDRHAATKGYVDGVKGLHTTLRREGKMLDVICHGLVNGETYTVQLFTATRRRGNAFGGWRHPSNENTGIGFTGKGYARLAIQRYAGAKKTDTTAAIYPEIPEWMPRNGILQTEWSFTAAADTHTLTIDLAEFILPMLKPEGGGFGAFTSGAKCQMIGVARGTMAPLLMQFRVERGSTGAIGESKNTLRIGEKINTGTDGELPLSVSIDKETGKYRANGLYISVV